MFALGHIHFQKHILWVTPPVFSLEKYVQGTDNLPYYEVMLTKKELPTQEDKVRSELPPEQRYNFYVDIMSEPILRGVMEVDARNQPIKDFTDMIQYQSYLDRKGSSQPLYKLSKANVIMLIGMLDILDTSLPIV